MDSRWKFLHYMVIKKCGDACGTTRARNGKPRASGGGAGEENPSGISQGRDADRIKSREAWETRAEKSRYIYHIPVPQTDTGRQGEDPKAGGRSIAKELGKMAP